MSSPIHGQCRWVGLPSPFWHGFHLLCRHYFDTQWVSGYFTSAPQGLYPGGSMHTNNAPHFRNPVDNALTGILDNTLEGKILFVKQGVKRG